MQNNKGKYFREMKVAYIRERSSPDYAEIVFLESARFYKLRKSNPKFSRIKILLMDAQSENKTLKVYLSSLESDIIEDVSE